MTVEEHKAYYGIRPPFISKVHLKGYKSIKDTEIEFKPGLNIVIGPNGSGKTNLLDFLIDLKNIRKIKNSHSCEISYYDWEGKNWFYSKKSEHLIFSAKTNKPLQKITETLKKDDKFIVNKKEYNLNNETLIDYWRDIERIFSSTKINFDLPTNIPSLNDAITIKLAYKESGEYYQLDGSSFEDSNIAQDLYSTIIHVIIFQYEKKSTLTQEDLVDKNLFTNLPFYEKNINNLKKFSPIKNLKIDDDVSVKIKKEGKETSIEIKHLRLAFLVDDEWLNWDMLSDGTKRLFYIIFLLSGNQPYNKYLIEEPELGIHPHQLSLLMTFLKEKSEDNQIIITTHSPQVLNILEMDELDRIIITKNEKKKGTTLRNLSDRELKKAKSFMEEDGLSLSDYWIHSDLEEQML